MLFLASSRLVNWLLTRHMAAESAIAEKFEEAERWRNRKDYAKT